MRAIALLLFVGTILGANAQTNAPPNKDALNRSLFDACVGGDLDRVKSLLVQGADPEARGWHDLTPLAYAAANKRWEVVRYFISIDADMNVGGSNGTHPLVYVLENNQSDLAIAMLNAGADPDFCDPHYLLPIVYPARTGDVRLMKAFIDHHANVNLNGTNGPALYHAVGYNQLAIVQMLLDSGAQIDIAAHEGEPPEDKSMSLVGSAAINNNLTMIDLLLDHGADINAMGEDGHTPLITAILQSTPYTIRHLIEKGADVNKPAANGETPLMFACDYGFNPIGVLQPLLDHGAKIEQTDAAGRTALVWCAMQDLDKPIYFLMQHGANLNAADQAGETALTYAADRGDGGLVNYFRRLGAKRTDVHIIARPLAHPPLTTAQAWAVAVGAMYAQYTGRNPHLLGGEDVPDIWEVRRDLKTTWDATDRNSFQRALVALRDQGYGTDYRRQGRLMAALSDDAPETEAATSPYTETQLEMIQGGYRKWGDRLGLTWDLCRYINLVGLGFDAGYLNEKEAWNDIMPAAREVQANFHSWREMSDNFLNGRIIWNDGLNQQFENCVGLLLNPADANSVWNQLPWKTDLGH